MSKLKAFTNGFPVGGMGGMGAQGGPRRARPIPGEDERYDIQLDFLDAVFGTT